MRRCQLLMIAALLFVSTLGHTTELWTGCETITAVSNYLAYNNSVSVVVSPAISGCTADGIGGSVAFTIGQDNVTSTNADGFLATALAAFASGQQVTIYYDNSTGACNGVILSVGGYAAQCL
jgi:hypothetical protein